MTLIHPISLEQHFLKTSDVRIDVNVDTGRHGAPAARKRKTNKQNEVGKENVDRSITYREYCMSREDISALSITGRCPTGNIGTSRELASHSSPKNITFMPAEHRTLSARNGSIRDPSSVVSQKRLLPPNQTGLLLSERWNSIEPTPIGVPFPLRLEYPRISLRSARDYFTEKARNVKFAEEFFTLATSSHWQWTWT